MSIARVVLIVLGVLVLLGVIQGVLVAMGILKLPKRGAQRTQWLDDIRTSVATRDETIVRGPTFVRYSGATGGGFSGVHNSAVATLTNHRLLIQTNPKKPTMDLPRAAIEDVREQKWYRTGASASRTHVVLRMKAGFEIGFSIVDDEAADWVRDISGVLATMSDES